MDKRSKIILGIFIAVLVGIMATEIVRPKPLNWSPSYTSSDKIPFGCYVLHQELKELFPNQKIFSTNQSLYNVLTHRDSSKASSYLIINDILDLDKQESNQLLNYVYQGNDSFIAATNFGSILSDTLNLRVETMYTLSEDTLQIRLSNPRLSNKTYPLARGAYNAHFTSVDSLNTTILGNITYSSEDQPLKSEKQHTITSPNFIKVKFGKGNFYLNSTPQTFTNYYMLRGNENYVSSSLSYLRNVDLYWDNYKKSGRKIIDSPMRFVLNQTSLKWAYYLGISGIFLFVIFKAKREQRIIPIIRPLENSSIEFAKTVGGLYYEYRDYTDLIYKKINFFLEHIRSNYHINTVILEDKTVRDLSAKTGKPIAETKALIDLLIQLKNKKQHSEQDLINLEKKLNKLKH